MNWQDINIENLSYFYGLMITDGTMSFRKERPIGIHIEVSEKDKDIVYKLNKIIKDSTITTRERNTNFKNNYKTYIFHYYNLEFCYYLIDD